jgi:serine/threonine protein kinase
VRGPEVTRVDAEQDVDPRDDELPGGDSASPAPTFLARGQTIGRYVIVECLGVGGMGIVYSAWDPKLDRKLAIKLVRVKPGASGGTRGRNRLLREAQALARVRHPNVITVHDVGAHEGRVFVAMEFVEGITLQQWLERRPERPYRELLDIFLQAGRGLAAAHRAGIVHRDFKPENVMIGSDGRVLVLDFGIARGPWASDDEPSGVGEQDTSVEDLGPSERVEDGMTRPGGVVGTPGYMSPEQRRRRPLDGRSDQFSFCVALWEALAGERPFGEGPPAKLLARIRLAQIRPMRRKDVPRTTLAALRRGLAWHRNDRFASMEGLLEALNPRGKPRSRAPLWLSLAAACTASLCAVVLGVQHFASEPAPTPSCALEHERVDALWSPARAQHIAALLEREGESGPTWLRARERIEAWTRRWLTQRAQACRAQLEHALSDELHDLRVACLERQLDRFALLIDELERPSPRPELRRIDHVIALVAALPEPERCSDDEGLREAMREPDSASARERLAALRHEAARLTIALELGELELESARQLADSAAALGHPPFEAEATLLLAEFLVLAGADEAETVLLAALRQAAAANELELEAEALQRLAAWLVQRGQLDEAERWLQLGEGLVDALTHAPALRVELLRTRAAIALARHDLAAAADALEHARTLLDGDDPRLQLPGVLAELAAVLQQRGEPDRALALQRRALALLTHQLGDRHPRVAGQRRNLALALVEVGDHDTALQELERALVLEQVSHGAGPGSARLRADMAGLHARLGRCTSARDQLDAAITELASDGPAQRELVELRATICSEGAPLAETPAPPE